ncbi:MAG: phosphatase PAP2 family protein [Candidatus Nomurabacteria bacterium]
MQSLLFNFFIIISNIGGETMMVAATTIISIIIFFWHKEEILAGFIFFNYIATMSLVVVLKYLIHKPRNPFALVHESSYAFPSGHTAAAAITLFLLFYLSRFIKNKSWKDFVKIFGIIWLILIISARLYLKVHDIYDILASILIAIFIFKLSLELKIFSKGILKKEIKELKIHE